MKNKILLLCFLVLTLLNIPAQTTFEVPQNPVLNTESDFQKYEKDVVSAAKWLEETDLDQQLEKRKDVNAFILKWTAGTSKITIQLTGKLGKIYGNNMELLWLYMANYSKNCIESKYEAPTKTAVKAGLISMINVYKKGIGIKPTKEMENVIKLQAENKLDDYIAKKLS